MPMLRGNPESLERTEAAGTTQSRHSGVQLGVAKKKKNSPIEWYTFTTLLVIVVLLLRPLLIPTQVSSDQAFWQKTPITINFFNVYELRSSVSWDVTPRMRSPWEFNRHFEETLRLYLQGERIRQAKNNV
jgi:hypothetical protein